VSTSPTTRGEIDWETLASQGIDFAWIKATEGSSHVDPRFPENWARANETGLLVGAYHFMSFESSGTAQAEHLAGQIPATPGTLPPVIDLELYGPTSPSLRRRSRSAASSMTS
jgi:lysozyme